jgi:Outer membrane protein beta-barrel domain
MLKPKHLLSLIFLCTTAKAQQKLSPAILVTAHNDSLHVWVKTRERLASNHSILIRKDSIQGNFEHWPASSIRSLAVTGGPYYIGAVVQIDKTPLNLEVNIVDSSSIKLANDTVLLTAEFISGKISLYSLTDEVKLHFYVQKPGGTIQELFDRKYLITRDGGSSESEDKAFILQLQQLMEDCPDLAGNLSPLSYNQISIKSILTKYNDQCGGKGKVEYAATGGEGKWQIGIFAGVSIPSITVKGGGATLGGNSTGNGNSLSSSASFAAGANFEYFLSGTATKFAILGSASYQMVKGSSSGYTEYGSATAYTQQTLTIDYSALRLDLLCRYTFPTGGKLLPFLNAGVSFSEALSNKNSSSSDEYYDNAHHITTSDPFNGGFKSLQPGLLAGAGLRLGRLGLEYRFASFSNIGSFTDASVHVNNQQILLSFNLKH